MSKNIEIPGVSDANAILQELGRPGTLYFIAQTDDQGNRYHEDDDQRQADGPCLQAGVDGFHAQLGAHHLGVQFLQELGRPGTLYFIAQTDDQGNQNYSQQTVQNPDGTYGVGYVLNKTIDELLEDGSIQVQGTDVKEASAGSLQTNMGSESTTLECSSSSSSFRPPMRMVDARFSALS